MKTIRTNPSFDAAEIAIVENSNVKIDYKMTYADAVNDSDDVFGYAREDDGSLFEIRFAETSNDDSHWDLELHPVESDPVAKRMWAQDHAPMPNPVDFDSDM